MKKLLICLLIFVSLFTIGLTRVEAAKNTKDYNNVNFIGGGGSGNVDCSGILTSDGIEIVKEVLGYFRLLAPIALLIMVVIDFSGAVISSDDKALTTAIGRSVKRAIAAVLLFFIPTMIRILLDLPGVRSVIEIPNDPLCGTMSSYPQENITNVG